MIDMLNVYETKYNGSEKSFDPLIKNGKSSRCRTTCSKLHFNDLSTDQIEKFLPLFAKHYFTYRNRHPDVQIMTKSKFVEEFCLVARKKEMNIRKFSVLHTGKL